MTEVTWILQDIYYGQLNKQYAFLHNLCFISINISIKPEREFVYILRFCCQVLIVHESVNNITSNKHLLVFANKWVTEPS